MARRTATADGERSRSRSWAGGIATALTFWTSQALSRALPAWPDSRHQSRLQSGSSRARLGARSVGPDRPRIRHSASVAVYPHQPASPLKPGDSGSASGARRLTLRNALVVGQLSLSVVVLIGAGCSSAASRPHGMSLGPGFSTDRLVSMRFDLASLSYPAARVDTFYRDLVTRVAVDPTRRGASIVNAPPFGEAAGTRVHRCPSKAVPRLATPVSKWTPSSSGRGTSARWAFRSRRASFDDSDNTGPAPWRSSARPWRAVSLAPSTAVGKRILVNQDSGTRLCRWAASGRVRTGDKNSLHVIAERGRV